MSSLADREKFGVQFLKNLKKGRIIYVGESSATNPMLLAPYAVLKHFAKTSQLSYGIASETITGNIHKLTFDEVDDIGPAGVMLKRRGEDQAFISPLSEEKKLRAEWDDIKELMFSPTAMENYMQELKILSDWENK